MVQEISGAAAGFPTLKPEDNSFTSSAPSAGEVIIAAGQSLSAVVDLGAQRLHRIVIPAGFTAADITFQSSADGVSFNDVFDMLDGEVKIPVALVAAGRTIVVNQSVFYGMRYLKIRSGTSAAPVVQATARTIPTRTVAR